MSYVFNVLSRLPLLFLSMVSPDARTTVNVYLGRQLLVIYRRRARERYGIDCRRTSYERICQADFQA